MRARTSLLATPSVVLALSGRLFLLRVSPGMETEVLARLPPLSGGESVAVLGNTGHIWLRTVILDCVLLNRRCDRVFSDGSQSNLLN